MVKLITFIVIFAFFCHANDDNPEKFIKGLYKEIKVINLSKVAFEMQLQKIKNVIIKNTEFDIISRFILGPYYKRISSQDFEDFKNAYKNYLGDKYSKLLLGYNQNLTILNTEEVGKNKFFVHTTAKLNDAKSDVKISYLIVLINGEYKIIDIIFADGVSVVITDRNEFITFLERNPVSALINKLNS